MFRIISELGYKLEPAELSTPDNLLEELRQLSLHTEPAPFPPPSVLWPLFLLFEFHGKQKACYLLAQQTLRNDDYFQYEWRNPIPSYILTRPKRVLEVFESSLIRLQYEESGEVVLCDLFHDVRKGGHRISPEMVHVSVKKAKSWSIADRCRRFHPILSGDKPYNLLSSVLGPLRKDRVIERMDRPSQADTLLDNDGLCLEYWLPMIADERGVEDYNFILSRPWSREVDVTQCRGPDFRLTTDALTYEEVLEHFVKAWNSHAEDHLWMAALIGDWISAHELAKQSKDKALIRLTQKRAKEVAANMAIVK